MNRVLQASSIKQMIDSYQYYSQLIKSKVVLVNESRFSQSYNFNLKKNLLQFGWDVFIYSAYSPDLTPSDVTQ